MNNVNQLIARKYHLDLVQPSPINILNTGRASLAELFAELGFTTGVEIGVEAGLFSQVLCQANPQLTLYCIDPWQAYPGYREHVSQAKLDQLYQTTNDRLKLYNHRIIRDFSEAAYTQFSDSSLDFVYIDGNHDFLHVTQDLSLWIPKVRPGGIISGHDFRRDKDRNNYVNDVKVVISAYTLAKGVSPWFVIRDPQESPSWFWVKIL